MPHTVDKTAAVASFLSDDLGYVVCHLTVVFPVGYVLLELLKLAYNLEVGSAVPLTFKRAYSGRIRRIRVCIRRSNGTAGKGGVVASAVFRVQDKHKVKKPRLLLGVLPVGS